jgi:hypothetical protein
MESIIKKDILFMKKIALGLTLVLTSNFSMAIDCKHLSDTSKSVMQMRVLDMSKSRTKGMSLFESKTAQLAVEVVYEHEKISSNYPAVGKEIYAKCKKGLYDSLIKE